MVIKKHIAAYKSGLNNETQNNAQNRYLIEKTAVLGTCLQQKRQHLIANSAKLPQEFSRFALLYLIFC